MAEISFPRAEQPYDIGPWRVAHAEDTGVVGSANGTDRSVYVNATGMYVRRRAGARFIQGIYATHDDEKQLAVSSNATGQVRYDRVVDRLLADGTITTEVKVGTSAGPPALTQVAGGTWEETLGSFPVPAGATNLTLGASPVTDERRFMPRRVTPVSSETLRPASPTVGDEVDYPNGGRERWDGTSWVGGGWSTYTPSLPGTTLGNGAVAARCKRDAVTTVHIQVRFLVGSTTALGGPLTIGLPFPAVGDVTLAARLQNAAGTIYQPATAFGLDPTKVGFATTAGVLAGSTNVPFAWSGGAIISFGGTYETSS